MGENSSSPESSYKPGTDTEASYNKPAPAITPVPSIEPERDKYATGKPKRVVIRAKIIHDQS